MSAEHEKVDFDLYARDYEALLENQQTMFGGRRSYFSQYKVDVLRRLFPEQVGSILDFGAGVGLSLPFIQKRFPEAKIHATDISAASLAHLADSFPDVTVVSDAAATAMRFDLILVITVLHHVEPNLRDPLMRRLASMLNRGGSLCVFEHNPHNPMTRRMVSTCVFDSDAVLLSRREAARLMSESARLDVTDAAYTLFLPHALRTLRFLEPHFGWLPFGGQYYVIGRRN